MKVKTISSEQTKKLAQDLTSTDFVRACGVSGPLTIGLVGDLGSGKTTFVQGIAEALGITDHITSPTFVLMKRYETKNECIKELIHIDAYRLSPPEVGALDIPELLKERHALILVEWPEKIVGAIPLAKEIRFQFVNESEREIEY